jgi:hypothetical protein
VWFMAMALSKPVRPLILCSTETSSCKSGSTLHQKLNADCHRYDSIPFSISGNATLSFLEALFGGSTSSTASYGKHL